MKRSSLLHRVKRQSTASLLRAIACRMGWHDKYVEDVGAAGFLVCRHCNWTEPEPVYDLINPPEEESFQ